MGYLHEKRMKEELNEIKNRLDERITGSMGICIS